MMSNSSNEHVSTQLPWWRRHKRAVLAGAATAIAVALGAYSESSTKVLKVGAIEHVTLNHAPMVLKITEPQTLPDVTVKGTSRAGNIVVHKTKVLGFTVNETKHEIEVVGPVQVKLGSCVTHQLVISPQSVTSTEIQNLIAPYGGGEVDYHTSFVDPEHRYVQCETATVDKARYPDVKNTSGHTDTQLVSFQVS